MSGSANQPELGPVFAALRADLDARNLVGYQTYRRMLLPHDGRDSLRDAYEEAIDLAVYLKKLLMERES